MQEVVSFLHEHTNEAITIDIQADDGTKEANELKSDLKSASRNMCLITESRHILQIGQLWKTWLQGISA